MEAMRTSLGPPTHLELLEELIRRGLSDLRLEIGRLEREIEALEDKYGIDSKTFAAIWSKVGPSDLRPASDELARWRALIERREELRAKVRALEEMLEKLSEREVREPSHEPV
ncbi:MAG: hypothetical protein DRJ56_06130, partial [Thermoprotei archaeon]